MRKAEFCVKPSAFSLAQQAVSAGAPGAAQALISPSSSTLPSTATVLTPGGGGGGGGSAVEILTAENTRLMEKVRELTLKLESCGGQGLRHGLRRRLDAT